MKPPESGIVYQMESKLWVILQIWKNMEKQLLNHLSSFIRGKEGIERTVVIRNDRLLQDKYLHYLTTKTNGTPLGKLA